MTIIIVGVLVICGIGLLREELDFKTFLAVASSWVTAIIVFYFPRK